MKHQAIRELYPNAIEIRDDYDAFDINGNAISIDKNAVDAKEQELISAYNNKQYQRERAREYISIKEQLDMMYWDKVNNTETWKEYIASVKTKYPKP